MKSWKFGKIYICILCVGVMLSVLTCSSKKDSGHPIKVGAVLPLTGNLAFLGEAIRNGMEMAKDEINETDDKGGPIEVVYEDSKGNARDGVSATRKVIDVDKIKFLIVNLTNVAFAVGPIVDEKETLGLVLSTHPEILKNRRNLVRIFVSGAQESKLIVNYAREKGYHSFSILHVNDAYGKGTGDFLRSMLATIGTVSGVHEYDLGDGDFRPVLTKGKRENPDALIVIGYGREYPTLFRQMKEMGWQPPVLSNLSFANLAGQALDRNSLPKISYAAPAYLNVEWRTEESKIFSEKYELRYDKKPDFNAAYGYDNLMMLIKAIKEAGSDSPERVNKALRSIKGYRGAIGRIDVLNNGDSETDMRMVEGLDIK